MYPQVLNNDFLQQKGESRYSRPVEISAMRGRIVDRHGEILASSTPVKSVWAIPEGREGDARTTARPGAHSRNAGFRWSEAGRRGTTISST